LRSLPVPGRDARRQRRQQVERDRFERAYAATGERIAIAEDNLTKTRTGMDKIRSAMDGFLTRKGDTP
jgi:hypothetical protein